MFNKKVKTDKIALKSFNKKNCLNINRLSILATNANILKFDLYLKEDYSNKMDLTSFGRHKSILDKYKGKWYELIFVAMENIQKGLLARGNTYCFDSP